MPKRRRRGVVRGIARSLSRIISERVESFDRMRRCRGAWRASAVVRMRKKKEWREEARVMLFDEEECAMGNDNTVYEGTDLVFSSI